MNRRGFLRFLGGGAAVATVAAVAPSQVWPFTKIFLPQSPAIIHPEPLTLDELLAANAQFGPLNESAIQAIELESFAKEIPGLFFSKRPFYKAFESKGRVDFLDVGNWDRPTFRVPARIVEPGEVRMRNGSKIVFTPADSSVESHRAAESATTVSEVLSSLDRDIRSAFRS